MKLLKRHRDHQPREEAADPGSSEAGAADQVPISGYDRLDAKEVGGRLHELSQVELATVEAYERAHKDRKIVLDKLRYMRMSEPLPDYDALTPEQIGKALVDADTATIKSVRDYENKFARRTQVLGEAARILPKAPASAAEKRSREEKAERLREGYAVRKKTAEGL